LAVLFIWTRFMTWVDKDAEAAFLPREAINGAFMGGAVLGFALFFILPGFWICFGILMFILLAEGLTAGVAEPEVRSPVRVQSRDGEVQAPAGHEVGTRDQHPPGGVGRHRVGLVLVHAEGHHRALYLLKELGLTGEEDPASLSGGEARRAALARALAPSPDILLLDEPTNHLDLPGIEWLERELAGIRSGIVLISHDRRLLERVSRTTIWLDRGITRTLDKGFEAFEAWRDTVLEQEDSEQHKLGRKIAMEEDWLRYGVTARRTRNQRRLAELHALRRKRKEQQSALGTVRLTAAQADLSGRLVAVAEGISKSYGGPPIVRDFSVRIMRGDRVGIVGPNGAGKTTLLNLLMGTLAPDAGEVRLGTNLAPVILDQSRDTLDPERTLAETLTGGAGDNVTVAGQSRHVVGYMKDFLFRPEQARTPVGVLSGGERARLTLACAFARPSNLLVLDEPTNDLDLETLDLLQERLAEYPGTVLLVSHDRDFIDRVVTSVIAVDGNGRWIEYAGGYTDMLAQREAAGREMPRAKAPVAKSARPTTEIRVQPAVPANSRARRIGFNERRALETWQEARPGAS